MALDNHEVWAEARANPVLGKLAVKEIVRQSLEALTADQVQELPEGLRARIEALCYLERRPVFNRAPRRFPELLGVVPVQAWRAGRPRILAALDTSGSITDEMLAQIAGELAHLARAAEVMVVECDAQIQATYPFRGALENVHGRGGTDLQPPLESAFVARLRVDLIVYFTDGAGPAPARPPRVPVIWCLTKEGTAPVPWGRCVRMNEPPSR